MTASPSATRGLVPAAPRAAAAPAPGTPLRVCLVVGYDLAETGGVKHHAVQLANALRAAGDHVTIIGPASRPITEAGMHGFRGVVKVMTRASGSSNAIGAFIQPWQVHAFFRRNAFDVVHVHEPLLPPLGYYAVWSSRNAAQVATFHAFTESPTRGMGIFGRLAALVQAPLFDLSTAVSEPAARYARSSWSWPSPIAIVPNGVPLRTFVPPSHERAPGPARLLFVGRQSDPRKGFAHLRTAFLGLRARGVAVTLDAVGDCDGAPVPVPGVTYHGSLPLSGLVERYQRCDVFVAPSTGMESFGIVLLEAMAAGRPIVCSDIEGYRNTVTSEGAWLAPPGDPRALERRLGELIARPEVWPVMGAANRRRAELFSWDRIATEMRETYVEAVARRAHPRLRDIPKSHRPALAEPLGAEPKAG
jgi:phosphatidyl-myo-inositol alpha-mannosyltransferase